MTGDRVPSVPTPAVVLAVAATGGGSWGRGGEPPRPPGPALIQCNFRVLFLHQFLDLPNVLTYCTLQRGLVELTDLVPAKLVELLLKIYFILFFIEGWWIYNAGLLFKGAVQVMLAQ